MHCIIVTWRYLWKYPVALQSLQKCNAEKTLAQRLDVVPTVSYLTSLLIVDAQPALTDYSPAHCVHMPAQALHQDSGSAYDDDNTQRYDGVLFGTPKY